MSAMSIQLTDALRSRLEARATEGGFDSVEAYIQAMLVADAAGPAMDDEQLERLLASRVDGPFVDADAADFKSMRAKLERRLNDETREAKP